MLRSVFRHLTCICAAPSALENKSQHSPTIAPPPPWSLNQWHEYCKITEALE